MTKSLKNEKNDECTDNPGNIGSKDRIKAVADACNARGIPIRIGVNGGSLEKQFEEKYGATPKGMIESALYNIKLLEDFGFMPSVCGCPIWRWSGGLPPVCLRPLPASSRFFCVREINCFLISYKSSLRVAWLLEALFSILPAGWKHHQGNYTISRVFLTCCSPHIFVLWCCA